ncbi:MAG: diacylglycerol/lipid kinase family protein [Bacteroidota bacterium]
MRVLIILNGISRRKTYFYRQIVPALQQVAPVTIWETKHAGHAEALATKGALEDYELIMAAGGDGTLHQVVNGLLSAPGRPLPAIGLIPLGSGNDFARTLGIKSKPKELASRLAAAHFQLVDVGKVAQTSGEGNESTRYFMNACSLGLGPEVVRRLQRNTNWGASWSYFSAIVRTFLTLKPQSVAIRWPDGVFDGRVCVFAVANGKAFGHAVYIAPDAQADDGVLNSFIAGDFPVWRFLLYLQSIKAGKKVKHANILYRTLTEVEVTSPETLPLEMDGELEGFTPFRVEVLPRHIRFLV